MKADFGLTDMVKTDSAFCIYGFIVRKRVERICGKFTSNG